jgi:predicted dehydrogenase
VPEPIEAVLVGAGSRGHFAYGQYALAHPDQIRFTAVVEPHPARRLRFAAAHAIDPGRQFESWDDLYAHGLLAPVLVNCTLDRMHLESTLPALRLGYDVLLEKPMANRLEGCVALARAAKQHQRLLMICHVLRFTPFFSTIHDLLASGELGEIVTMEHRENVVYWHMAHSFVRGNWRSSREESPMILAKCCHDLDILFWNLGPVRRLSSFGSLRHYRPENAPDGAPQRCTDGCPVEDECPWFAPRLYLREDVGWPVSVISQDTHLEARREALDTGPYGRCVYRCDNDVVDNQTINLEFESGATGLFAMHGHSHQEGRTMRYDGTRATLIGRFVRGAQEIEVHDHATGRVRRLSPANSAGGHGGGDAGLMAAFVRAIRDESDTVTSAEESLESHLMAFAAEESRASGTVVQMGAYRIRATQT